jgi:LuxR family transcriptional regulator, maltose regulon positive regulatory protein
MGFAPMPQRLGHDARSHSGRAIELLMRARAGLTARETELLRRLSRGLSNQELADRLSITVGTTKGHLHRIFRKLGVRNRTAAVAKARELKLL